MLVTEALYEAAVIPEMWGKALNLASRAWTADGVVIASHPDCLGGLIFSEGVEDLCARYIDEQWYKCDVRAARGVPTVRRGADIVTDLDLFTADELEHLPYYSEFLSQAGFRWFAGSTLHESGGALITLSAQRQATRDPFSRSELARIQHDLPHVRRAARLASKVQSAHADGLVDGLERFDCGAVLIDRLGRVIRLNKKAEIYLGDHLQVVSSRLRSAHRESNKSLQNLIAASTRPILENVDTEPISALLHRPNDLPLVVNSYPVVRQASDVFQGARAILLINDPSEQRLPAQDILQEVFQLTAAELRVAEALLRGLDTQEIASKHQVGSHTVRYHLKSLFAKTGTSRQAQLVSLLSRFGERSSNSPG
jgi:DNA-binding CsgD family transcriptional regulator